MGGPSRPRNHGGEDRALQLLWYEDLPRPRPPLHSRRQQALLVPGRALPRRLHDEAQPPQVELDPAVPSHAQEGHTRGSRQETRSPDCEGATRCGGGGSCHHQSEENQKPEVRQAAREAALREVKSLKKATKSKNKGRSRVNPDMKGSQQRAHKQANRR